MDIKPETARFVVCSTSDLLEGASFNVEAWLYRKISEGMRATINAGILLSDGIGKPMGLLNPNRHSNLRGVRRRRLLEWSLGRTCLC
jgi:HK97 family phage major capsid protein